MNKWDILQRINQIRTDGRLREIKGDSPRLNLEEVLEALDKVIENELNDAKV